MSILKIVKELNKKGIFHKVTASGGVEILRQPADLTDKDKDFLKTYYGMTDFTVPERIEDPFTKFVAKEFKKGK